MQTVLDKLYQTDTLNQQESYQLFNDIINGKLTNEQLVAVLITLKIRGETPAEIAGAALASLENAKPFPRPDYLFADIVGTGGDGTNSINISTASAFVAACCGVKVAKHGNRSVSSRSGSSDLLSAFGVKLDVSAKQSRQNLDELNVCFLAAPHYHPGFRHVAQVRQHLKTRTLFNILGPLINPARPPVSVIGVYSPALIKPVIETVAMLGYQRVAVIHGSGMDEVAVHGTTHVAEYHQGNIHYYTLQPDDFGLSRYSLTDLTGGDAAENKALLTAVLQGQGQPAHTAAVAANTALLLHLCTQQSLPDCTLQALDVMASGHAYQRLMSLVSRG